MAATTITLKNGTELEVRGDVTTEHYPNGTDHQVHEPEVAGPRGWVRIKNPEVAEHAAHALVHTFLHLG